MKQLVLILILIVSSVSFCEAEEPRTVVIYKRHMNSADHNANDFEHNLHHMLYLSGVGDAYASVNKMRKEANQPRLYCQPETAKLTGSDLMKILDKKLYHPEHPAADDLTVSEAMLQALKEEFPCP